MSVTRVRVDPGTGVRTTITLPGWPAIIAGAATYGARTVWRLVVRRVGGAL